MLCVAPPGLGGSTASQISGQRALTVKNAAVAKGVKKERLLAVGFGQTKPIGDNTTDAGRAKNRQRLCTR